MTDTDFDFLPLRVTRTCADGKHRYDTEGKRKLIEACRRPGASLAGLALKAGVNANQLRKWVQLQERREGAAVAHDVIEQTPSAFVPVVMVDDPPTLISPETAPPAPQSSLQRALPRPSPRSAPHARLSATLPNGVVVELECSGRDTSLVTAMIAALGAR
ncbi:transposase [Burkholderia ubonensis]|uniref:IS66-like element accessory protein TnpA n=1 Tax=Burkholderia ubonensis TaxID=101571 RepID=UPI000753FA0F|nr:transposase [Burkholderia ubonensis]KVT89064.1 transposase [Burkholderia ubonensis]